MEAGSSNTSNVHHHTLLTLSATCTITIKSTGKTGRHQNIYPMQQRTSLFQPNPYFRKVAHFSSSSLIFSCKPAGGKPAGISLGRLLFLLSIQIIVSLKYLRFLNIYILILNVIENLILSPLPFDSCICSLSKRSNRKWKSHD